MIPKALGEYLTLEFIQPSEKSKAGIIIADNEQSRKDSIVYLHRGKIVSAGKDVKLDVKIGDIVFFTPYDSNVWQEPGEKRYDVLNYKHIKGKL